MEIKTISYEELVSGDNFSNKRIGATCAIQEGEKPEDAFTNLVYWVKEQFSKIGVATSEYQELEDRIYDKCIKLRDLEREFGEMQRRWKLAVEFLEKHGVNVPENYIPF